MPMMMKPSRARVHRTFSRCSASALPRKPMLCLRIVGEEDTAVGSRQKRELVGLQLLDGWDEVYLTEVDEVVRVPPTRKRWSDGVTR